MKIFHGYGGISTKILKLTMSYISSPLTYICNKMFSTGTFPSRLKFSEIQPLFKKGDKTKILQISDPSPCLQPSQNFQKDYICKIISPNKLQSYFSKWPV